jgi:Flp pilus assembly protein TadG
MTNRSPVSIASAIRHAASRSSTVALARDVGGAVAVEFGLLSSVLLFMLLCATDLAMAINTKMKVSDAARSAAQYAAINGWNSTGVTNAAKNATSLSVTVAPTSYCGCPSASGISAQTCGTTCAAGSTAGTYVSVVVSGSYTPILSNFWGAFLTGGLLSMTSLSITRVS